MTYGRTLGRIGRSSVLFAAVGGAWSVGNGLAEAVRETDDTFNSIIGACASGAVVGIYAHSTRLAFGAALAFSAASVFLDLAGGSLFQQQESDTRRLRTFHNPEA